MRDGLLGLILFIGHWLSPDTGKANVSAEFIKNEVQYCQFQCKLDIAWNRQLEQLVEAGIPLRFNILCASDKSDTLQFTRTLMFDMVDFTYGFTDTTSAKVIKSQQYTLVHLALRDFCKWNFKIKQDATLCRVEVMILPGLAKQLNRIVDMSRVWGQQKVYCQFVPQEKIKAGSQRKK
ncbi:MAG TPA: hypothetical protein VHP36_10420 [Chitinispirillaceae bacterium]|nr:hypothetical protein [Chitinispirillaceae bacterium]